MKRVILLSAFVAIAFFACKEEEINDQQFVKNHFIGKWPLKIATFKTTKNGVTILDSTVNYGIDSPVVDFPVDTLEFTNDGKYLRKEETFTYTIDETGDNISYSTLPAETWKIKYLRLKSIILTQEKTEKTGNDTFIYYKEEQLIK